MSLPNTVPQWIASANISPSRFIAPTGANYTVSQAANATLPLVGISAEAVRRPPGTGEDDGLNAKVGEQVKYHAPGQICNLVLGANTTFGQLLTSTTGGNGTPITGASTSLQFVGAMALGNGVTGDKIKVWVLWPFTTGNTS